MNSIGNRIKTLREQNEMTQQELANKMNVHRQIITYYENDDRQPKIEDIKKLSAIFGVSSDYLLCLSEYKNSSEIKEVNHHLNDFLKNLEKISYYEQLDLIRISDNIANALISFDERDPFRFSYISGLTMLIMNIYSFIKFYKISPEEDAKVTEALENFNSAILMNHRYKDYAVNYINDIYKLLNEKLKEEWQDFSKANELGNYSLAKDINYYFDYHLKK